MATDVPTEPAAGGGPRDDGGADEGSTGDDHADREITADGEQRCDLCGAPMLEWHCRIICTFCGYQRDCSDP
jgi:hypothetical protein